MRNRFKNLLIPGVTIERAAAEGKCVAKWQDRVVFVEGVAPGDVADIRVIRHRKSYLEAIPVEILRQSPLRTAPFCSHFGTCGGCQWQHISYRHQLEFKRQQVIDSLQRIAKVDFPEVHETLPSPEQQYYRNKLEFTFSNRRWLQPEEISSGQPLDRNGVGFHKPRQFDKVVDLQHCYLQPDPSNAIRLWLKEYAQKHDLNFYDILKKEGFLRNLIIRTSTGGQLMVIVQVGQDLKNEIDSMLSSLKEAFPQITSLLYVINNKGNETFFDLPVHTFWGQDHIMDHMEDLQFRIGPKSFYQTNSGQGLQLYQLVRSLADLSGVETVYDLYSGTGTIALFMAKAARKVIGLEQVEEAVNDARVNASLNGIHNAVFYSGDIKDIFTPELAASEGPCEVLITDPPRAGMHEQVLRQIISMQPQLIIYVSCNPATQARDVSLLSAHYQILAVHPLDMFPHTHHVESVISLQRK